MTTKGEILKAIRSHCLECCCGSDMEVKICTVGLKCALYPYRTGKDPKPARKGRKDAFQNVAKMKGNEMKAMEEE